MLASMAGTSIAHRALPRAYPSSQLLAAAVLAAAYYGAAKLGYQLQFSGPVAAIVWLPAGVGIAFLYLGGLSLWPGVVIGDLLANDYSTLPFGSAVGQTCGNVLEVVVATVLIRRLAGRDWPLATVRGLGCLLAGILVGTALSATIGVLSLRLGDVTTAGAMPRVWRTWWLGDACGALLVVPLALAWYRPMPHAWRSARALEGALMLAVVAGLSEIALHTVRPAAYLVFPGLIWAALRFGRRGATLAVAVAAGFVVYGTTHYVGPFHYDSITRSLLSAQLFIAVSALTTLCLAVVASEREQFARRLAASRARLVDAADGERRRIERNLHDGAQQRLVAVAVRLRTAQELDPARAGAAIARAEAELQEAIEELRRLAHGIHPPVLTELGLAGAVREVAGRATMPVVLGELPAMRFDDTTEATAYYVVSEAIANAQKHSGADAIRVRVALGPSVLHVEVADDGAGGAIETPGSGLEGLRDRVEAVGGTFALDSPAGRGTRIHAVIPI
jgi:signal transduction histidine kinase